MSYERLGDVAVAQGQLDEAAQAYGDSLRDSQDLAASDPANANGSGTSLCPTTGWRRGGGARTAREAARAYGDGLTIRKDPGGERPQQHRVAARPLGLLRQTWATWRWRKGS